MKHGGDKTTLARARQHRRNATLPERLLWAAIRRKKLGLRFRKQHPVGPSVLDFYCASIGLCIEVDGSQHDFTVAVDRHRDRWLEDHDIRTVRVPAKEVLRDPDAVAQWIASQAPLPPLRATSP